MISGVSLPALAQVAAAQTAPVQVEVSGGSPGLDPATVAVSLVPALIASMAAVWIARKENFRALERERVAGHDSFAAELRPRIVLARQRAEEAAQAFRVYHSNVVSPDVRGDGLERTIRSSFAELLGTGLLARIVLLRLLPPGFWLARWTGRFSAFDELVAARVDLHHALLDVAVVAGDDLVSPLRQLHGQVDPFDPESPMRRARTEDLRQQHQEMVMQFWSESSRLLGDNSRGRIASRG